MTRQDVGALRLAASKARSMPTRSSNIPASAGLCAEGGYDLDALAESTASMSSNRCAAEAIYGLLPRPDAPHQVK